MELLPFGTSRRLYIDGELQPNPPTEEDVLLRMRGSLAAGASRAFSIPYNGKSQEVEVKTGNNSLRVTSQDYNAFRFCEGTFPIRPPFRGGQCDTIYAFFVVWYDPVTRQRKSREMLFRGPIPPLVIDSEGALSLDGAQLVFGGEERIRAPRIIKLKRWDGLPDNCGDIKGPNIYSCPENPYPLTALGSNQTDTPYLANNWLLNIIVSSDVATDYRVDFRI